MMLERYDWTFYPLASSSGSRREMRRGAGCRKLPLACYSGIARREPSDQVGAVLHSGFNRDRTVLAFRRAQTHFVRWRILDSMGDYPEGHHDIVMILEDLSLVDLSAFGPEEILARHGCAVVPFEDGMQDEWLRIQDQADAFNVFGPDVFFREFGDDVSELERRMFFLRASSGRLVGTATAWYPEPEWGAGYGRIHWVALLPGYQGKGLSKPLMCRCLAAMRSLGDVRSYLTTNTARTAAIGLYESFGFVRGLAPGQVL